MRYKFWGYYVDLYGNAIPEGNVSVYVSDTGEPAIIYATEDATDPLTEPPQLQTDQNGYFEFWVDPNDYTADTRFKIVLEKEGFNTVTIDKIHILQIRRFIDLDDTPSDLTGKAKKPLIVKDDETGIDIYDKLTLDTNNIYVNALLDLLSNPIGNARFVQFSTCTEDPDPYAFPKIYVLQSESGTKELIFSRDDGSHRILIDDDYQSLMAVIDNHKAAIPIDHPDKSVTKEKLADNIDASDIGFVADKVDGCDVDDSLVGTNILWTSQRIIDEINARISQKDEFIELNDTPSSYTGAGGKFVRVKQDETGLEFGTMNKIADSDGDTVIDVEASPDEDTIRMKVAGTERMRIENTGAVTISGDVYAENMSVGGDITTNHASIMASLIVHGGASINSLLNVTGQLLVASVASIGGDLLVGGNLSVAGAKNATLVYLKPNGKPVFVPCRAFESPRESWLFKSYRVSVEGFTEIELDEEFIGITKLSPDTIRVFIQPRNAFALTKYEFDPENNKIIIYASEPCECDVLIMARRLDLYVQEELMKEIINTIED